MPLCLQITKKYLECFFYLGFFGIAADNFTEFEEVCKKKRLYQKQRTMNLLVMAFWEADCKFPSLSFKLNYVTVFGRLHFLKSESVVWPSWKMADTVWKFWRNLAYSASSTWEVVQTLSQSFYSVMLRTVVKPTVVMQWRRCSFGLLPLGNSKWHIFRCVFTLL